MTTIPEHEEAIARVEAVIATEDACGVRYARERAAALRSTVDGRPDPRRFTCTPSAEQIEEIRQALTEYEALRPESGFPDCRSYARAHLAAVGKKSQEGDYINRAIATYSRARDGRADEL